MKDLFGSKLIIVYDVDAISGSFSKEIKDAVKDPDRLKPNVVVLIYQNHRKVLKVEGSLVGKFKPVYDSDIPDWIRSFVKRTGFSISGEAANLLQFCCGADRGEIKKHIERVISVKDDQDKNIREEDLRNIGFYRDDTIFKITNSVVDGEYREALRYLIEYSDNVPIFHFINRDIRCLLEVHRAIMQIPTHAPDARSLRYRFFQPITLAKTRSALVSQKKNQHEKDRSSGMKYVRPTMARLKDILV